MSEGNQASPDGGADIATAQREVQRLLGRCLLRLQQYEQLLKAFLAGREVAGTVHTALIRQADRKEALRTASLGNLVTTFLGEYLTDAQAADREQDSIDKDVSATGLPAIRISMTMHMPAEQIAETTVALRELVELRNGLVHHLLEGFNVWTLPGCVGAAEHLSQSYSRIDQRFEELRGWVEHANQARSLTAQFLESQQFEEFLLHGERQVRNVEWAKTDIVASLREALVAVGDGEWARLDVATAWIGEGHPEQIPQRYGCVSWPQVLHESRAFQIDHRKAEDGRKVTWFRERLLSS